MGEECGKRKAEGLPLLETHPVLQEGAALSKCGGFIVGQVGWAVPPVPEFPSLHISS